ncbi:hypothetical protein [[Limnothrix rosea] IAM M-220]|uniref:hypothetical protein n=1 Tax=[Limnothrix rosea] IAM M-220 TaxID=454133 RepID=UPI00095D80D5|nr:hypothetical protein [[Limnothrix rosea] IAM M-220]OKH10928.1 hypothetical protein NIES208_18015 [[Limnothrix rosea] IAM M-220]
MQTIQAEVTVSDNRRLEIDLPEDVQAGTYQVVLVLNPQPQQGKATTPHKLNDAAGKLKIFSQVDPGQWQRQIRDG